MVTDKELLVGVLSADMAEFVRTELGYTWPPVDYRTQNGFTLIIRGADLPENEVRHFSNRFGSEYLQQYCDVVAENIDGDFYANVTWK